MKENPSGYLFLKIQTLWMYLFILHQSAVSVVSQVFASGKTLMLGGCAPPE